MKKKYNIIYSIGQDCACGLYMKKARIRCCSGPFDWLTNTSFENRINIILNDFEEDKFIIEKIEVKEDIVCGKYIENENIARCYIKTHDKIIIDKLNEIIEFLNRKEDK